jgi:hypothetical protein
MSGSELPNYFSNVSGNSDVYDLNVFEATYSTKRIVYWTTSLARSIGTVESETFNRQMRDYARLNGKILFDFADIEAHRPDGSECRNGLDYQIICETYTTESGGGHLGSMSTGKIRVAKAFWVLMAQVAGWRPTSQPPPPPPPAGSGTMHVSSMSGSSRINAAYNTKWNATVRVDVQDAQGVPVESADVVAHWDDGSSATCRTQRSGGCTLAKNQIPMDIPRVILTVENLTKPTLVYDARANAVSSLAVNRP